MDTPAETPSRRGAAFHQCVRSSTGNTAAVGLPVSQTYVGGEQAAEDVTPNCRNLVAATALG